MLSGSHRIRRMRWQVQAGPRSDPFALRKRLQAQWQALLPVIEAAFDSAAPGGEVIRIPKLELKVTVRDGEGWIEAIVEAIPRQLEEQLHALLASQGERTETVNLDPLRTLRRYLLTGNLPWHAGGTPASEVTASLEAAGRDRWRALFEALVSENKPEVYFRLLQILPEEEGRAFVLLVCDRLPRGWGAFLAEVCLALFPSRPAFFSRHAGLTMAAAFLSGAIASGGAGRPPDFRALAERSIPPDEKGRLTLWILLLPAAAAALFQPDFREGRTFEESRFDPGPLPPSLTEKSERNPERLQEIERRPLALEADAGRPVRVAHAGLILLHPFLSRFLESAGVKAPGDLLLPAENLPRAAALFHFLATGEERVYEYELGFIKVLLGLGPETPLPLSEGLVRSQDREEAAALLEAVIGYWTILKKTSIDGLRASFLRRDGLLLEEEGGFRLHLERTGFDLLIDRLPWGIGVVKLPWMKKGIVAAW